VPAGQLGATEFAIIAAEIPLLKAVLAREQVVTLAQADPRLR